jgi:hypothetical protein
MLGGNLWMGFFGAIERLLDPEEGVMVIQGITIINRVRTHFSSLPSPTQS